MEPLSVIASVVGTADVTFRLCRFLRRTIRGLRDVDKDVIQILDQVENLSLVNQSIREITGAPDFAPKLRGSFADQNFLTRQWTELWRNTEKVSLEAQRVLKDLEKLLRHILGANFQIELDVADEAGDPEPLEQKASLSGSLRKLRDSGSSRYTRLQIQVRKDSRSQELQDLRQQLANSQNSLSLCLNLINMGWNDKSHSVTLDAVSASRQYFTHRLDALSEQLASLRILPTPTLATSNKIFQAPSASNTFTGRESLLQHVEQAFDLVTILPHAQLVRSPEIASPSLVSLSNADTLVETGSLASMQAGSATEESRKQKRFVLIGQGGSGKTEFCCKFAERTQQRFWGVFWIDASSKKNIKHSFREVARVVGLEKSVKAALVWLASSDQPWLLIVDNADDSQMSIDQYLPGGDRGCVLFTSRRRVLKYLGNVGQGYCEFEKLDQFEASDLLLKQAHESIPWSEVARNLADQITQALGYLPLALVCVGKAIAEGVTTLHDCIDWFERSWDDLRMENKANGGSLEEGRKNVFAPYEAMIQSLACEKFVQAQGALQLLKMFSFFHHDNISYQLLVRAAENDASTEAANTAAARTKIKEDAVARGVIFSSKPKSWQRTVRASIFATVQSYLASISQSALPIALRQDQESQKPFDEHRLRCCLVLLSQKSLLIEREKDGGKVYSLHPLYHKWIRERMQLRERGLWCEAAIETLNQCIPMPPLGEDESDMRFRGRLVPHLDAVRKFQKDIENQVEDKRRRRMLSSFLLTHTSSTTRAKAIQFAKFSRVYAENGVFKEAKVLLEAVKDYLIGKFGTEDERSILVMRALSSIYFWLSQMRDAIDLQIKALEACHSELGPDHPTTLKIMDELGSSERNRGRYKESLKLHEDALAGMKRVLPEDDPDIFLCLANLGEVHHRYLRFDKAVAIQERAVRGMIEKRKESHSETLRLKEMLADTYLEKAIQYRQQILLDKATLENHADDLEHAYTLQLDVLMKRRESLGKENNFTLWAVLGMGRVKAALGQLEEAEAEMRVALEVGERNVGERHLAVLVGKTQLARVVAAQTGRSAEAEVMFQDVIDKDAYHKGARDEGEHPDHLTAVWYYAGTCEQSGKVRKALDLLLGISGGLNNIGAQRHPFWQMVGDKILELRGLLGDQHEHLGLAEKSIADDELQTGSTGHFAGRRAQTA